MASTTRTLAAGLVVAAAGAFAAEAQAQTTPVNNPKNLASVQAGAAPAVASSEAFSEFGHLQGNVNDGNYGNASSWISDS